MSLISSENFNMLPVGLPKFSIFSCVTVTMETCASDHSVLSLAVLPATEGGGRDIIGRFALDIVPATVPYLQHIQNITKRTADFDVI